MWWTPPVKVGPGCFKVKFTDEEDDRLREAVEQCGTKDWSMVARQMAGRSARQCRERWCNYINPTIANLPWTPAEEALLDEVFPEIGRKWKTLAKFFPQRSSNQIKNHWISRQKILQSASLVRLNPNAVQSTTPDQPAEVDIVQLTSEGTTRFDFVWYNPDNEDFFWDDLGQNFVWQL
jgi:hypothetical protein